MTKILKLIKNPKIFFHDAHLNTQRNKVINCRGKACIAFGISTWKRDVFEKYIGNTDVYYFGYNSDKTKVLKRIERSNIKTIYNWGAEIPPYIKELKNLKIVRVEDGFIRSIGLGAEHILPMSLCFDDCSIYYNAQEESRLEKLITTYRVNPYEVEKARRIINKIKTNKISKYNITGTTIIKNLPKNKKKVLVIGQVEEDQSIKYGASHGINNKLLLHKAIAENPGAMIIYRPHPDVNNGLRKNISNPEKSNSICHILDDKNIDLCWLLDNIDHVYTITSLTGFEALLRGKKVTTFGTPFYAGWGLTDDRGLIRNRNIKRSIEEVFFCAYILYPTYFSLKEGKIVSIEKIIDEIISAKKSIKEQEIKEINLKELNHTSDCLTKDEKLVKKTSTTSNTKKTSISLTYTEFTKKIAYGVTPEYNKIARSIWKQNPWELNSINIYIALLRKNNNYFELVDFLRNAIKKHPSNKEIKLLYCKYYKQSGRYDKSIKDNLMEIIDNDPTYHQARYFLCEYLWETSGITRELLHHLNILFLDIEKISQQAKLFICACYCEAGFYSKALSLYDLHQKEFSNLKKYYLLEAIIDSRRNNNNEKFQKIESIYKAQADFIDKIKRDKNFAVVGNGPVEIGSKNGSIIDSFDIVIRFNNYNLDHEYSVDYGTKTTVWVKSGYYQDIDRRYNGQFELVIQSGINPLFRNSSFEDFILDFDVLNIPFSIIPPTIYYELIEKIKHSPSAGLCILYWIYKNIGKIPKKNIFGFTIGEQKNNTSEHYFNNSKSVGFYPHNWDEEKKILKEIIDFNDNQ